VTVRVLCDKIRAACARRALIHAFIRPCLLAFVLFCSRLDDGRLLSSHRTSSPKAEMAMAWGARREGAASDTMSGGGGGGGVAPSSERSLTPTNMMTQPSSSSHQQPPSSRGPGGTGTLTGAREAPA